MVAELRDSPAEAAVGLPPGRISTRSSRSSTRSSRTSARSSQKSSSAIDVPLPSWTARALKNLEVSCASLQRGVPVASALRNFASVLSDRAPTEEYFELSVPVDALDVFISHNWSSPRWKKFLVIAFHFNLYRSFIISMVMGAIVCALMYHGSLPLGVASVAMIDDGEPYTRGFLALPVGVVVFVACLLFSHDLDRLPCSPFKRRMLWLDRTCVHQTQPDKKKEGIQCLAAFLARSEDILICYSDIYTTRLWTVYEVASWLMLHRGKRMLLRPLLVPVVLLGGLLTFTVQEVIVCFTNFSQLSTGVEIPPIVGLTLPILFVFPCSTTAAWLGATLARERERVFEHVKSFRLSDASCANEADRHIVQQNILAFMKLANLCDADAEDETVFAAFEELVRVDVPKLMRSSFGRVGAPYWWTALVFFPRALAYFDIIAGQLLESRPWRYVLLHFMMNASLVLAIGPLVTALVLASTRNPRFRSAPALAGLGALGTLLLGIFLIAFYELVARAVDSEFWLAVVLCGFTTLAVSTYAVYRP